jgi:dihydroneopterin aldolase
MWIRIRSLSLFAHHGAYEEERVNGNHFEIDVDVSVPDSFGASDSLESTLDYVRIFRVISERSASHRYILLERFCADICNDVLALDHAISEVIVRVRKLDPPAEATVKAVEVERRLVR